MDNEKKTKTKISVLLLTQNSERTIKRTMESIKTFDEILVIDGGSSDKTEDIVKEYSNARFIYNSWPGFIEQRNFSLTQASNEWCFMIDSDEACTPELVEELYRVVNQKDTKSLYRVVRTEYFSGIAIEKGLWKGAYQERLLKKSKVSYAGGVHHSHIINGEHVGADHGDVENLDSKFRILHDENYGMDEWMMKFPRFAILIAKEKMARGRKISAPIVFISLFGTFFQMMWKNRGMGKMGFIVSMLEAINRALVKLYIYQHHNLNDEKYSDKELLKKLN